jgi:hypothetical protein
LFRTARQGQNGGDLDGWRAVRLNQKNVFETIRTELTWLREIVDLASGGGERVFDRHLNMLVPLVVGRRMIDDDVFVRWNCKRDVDMEAAAVTVFVAGCDHGYAASNDMAIGLFQPLYFTFDRSARSLGRIGSFKSHLQRDLHDDLSVAVDP